MALSSTEYDWLRECARDNRLCGKRIPALIHTFVRERDTWETADWIPSESVALRLPSLLDIWDTNDKRQLWLQELDMLIECEQNKYN